MGRLQEYLGSKFGVPIKSTERNVTLGAVAIPVSQNNPNRFKITIFNLSANIAYIGFDSGVALANGILLAANGGQLGFDAEQDGELAGRVLYGIAAAGAPVLYIVEMEALI